MNENWTCLDAFLPNCSLFQIMYMDANHYFCTYRANKLRPNSTLIMARNTHRQVQLQSFTLALMDLAFRMGNGTRYLPAGWWNVPWPFQEGIRHTLTGVCKINTGAIISTQSEATYGAPASGAHLHSRWTHEHRRSRQSVGDLASKWFSINNLVDVTAKEKTDLSI